MSLNSQNMEGFALRRRTIIVESSEIRPDPTLPPQFDINFKFFFQTYNYYIRRNSGRIFVHNVRRSHITNQLISLNIQHFSDSNYSEACQILSRLFQDWPFTVSTRRTLVDFIWRRTNSREQDTGATLHFHLTTHNALHVLSDRGSTSCNMVPASRSAIDSLEIKIVEGGESCAICMDNMHEGFSMPCSHVFHEDCITKWLTISHYCPLCRLEMPTADAPTTMAT